MKKVTLVALVALLVVSFSGLAMAAPAPGPAQTPGNWYCPYYGQYYNNMTDEQKAQVATWHQQTLDQRKQMLQKQVEWGYMTQAQADQQFSWMEQQMANGTYMGMHGNGMMGMRSGMGCW
ncbi:YckD family protein [Sporomusa sphaeroides DSM 2875]|uniref:DUF2680 domain-containing protein n=1 Tax=Sporomusa sphaeroides TaxID=47679 RepID=UPI0020305B67|nr:DUF2680 domain-containing protein [Sporomusa sphaeroides]MCM0757289.1 YckD family protein [Sporomusa sphaeroides DSM 2875]